MSQLLANPVFFGGLFGFLVINGLLFVGGFASFAERRFAARMQNRVGPRFVGPSGTLQWVADGLKLMQKENIVPRAADPLLFALAPILPVFLVLASAAPIPFTGWWSAQGTWVNGLMIADLDVGVLWVLALAGLMVFPIWMAGWSSNNKYTLLAGMRGVAQGVSYEIPMVMAAMVPVVATGSLSLSEIVSWQAENGWLVWRLPVIGLLAFGLFFIASLAEANRIPFDIPEAESELLAGVYVEYTGLKSGIWPLCEYMHTFVACLLAAVLFLGGAHMPFLGLAALGPLWILGKALFLYLFIYWIRWSWFRFRADQLMELCWVLFVPGSLVLVMLTALQVWLEGP